MKLGIGIPTVPARLDLAIDIADKVNAEFVSVDDSGLWANARWCWRELADKDFTHCMVLQDDVEIISDFIDQASRIITEKPRDIISLFCSRACDVLPALKEGASWLEYGNLCWGQAIIMPTDFVISFLEWADRCTKDEWKMDDQRVAYWAILQKRNIYVPIPSILQHAKELHSTWADRAGHTLQAPVVGPWKPGPVVRPYQRGNQTVLNTKSRWLK